MSRPQMTSCETRVTNLLNNYLSGTYRNRQVNDKPDYINDLASGKSIGIEIIEFQPVTQNGAPYQFYSKPLFTFNERLEEIFNKIPNKNFEIYFEVYDSKEFLKDKKTISNILNCQDYYNVINGNFQLKSTNKFSVTQKDNTYPYGGLAFLEALELNSPLTHNAILEWMNINIIKKHEKIAHYQKTDTTALAIEDLHYSSIPKNDIWGEKERWSAAYKEFLQINKPIITFDQVYVVTKNEVILLDENISQLTMTYHIQNN